MATRDSGQRADRCAARGAAVLRFIGVPGNGRLNAYVAYGLLTLVLVLVLAVSQ